MHRNVRHGRLGWVRPGRVVSDDERGLMVWIARGTPVVNEVSADGRGMRTMPFTEWVNAGVSLQHGVWAGPSVLKFLPTGAFHSVWWFHDDQGQFSGYYVNLEEPGVKWDDGDVAGVDIVDQDLDVVVSPERAWRWKDEEEFQERLALPEHYWVADGDAVRAEGERVVKLIEAAEFPFDGSYVDYRPPASYEVPPELPPGWDRPAAR